MTTEPTTEPQPTTRPAQSGTRRPPVAELHLHIEGTLEPETIFELAERNKIDLPYAGLDDLRSRYEFTDLQSFLDLYYSNMQVLLRAEDFETMTWRYLQRAEGAGVRHCELFVDPQAHAKRGVPAAVVLQGVDGALRRARQELDISGAIIVCALRDDPVDEAHQMLDDCLASGVPILGLGLDSAEVGYPPRLFADLFRRAADAGLRRVAHAGEEGPPNFVREALDLLGAERIDHGVRSLEDHALVQHLVAERVPLTVCPLSNVRLRVVDRLADHPLKTMLQRDLHVTVNSDDPAYFGGYVDDNFDKCRAALGLDNDDIKMLAMNSIEAAFLDVTRRRALLAEVATFFEPQDARLGGDLGVEPVQPMSLRGEDRAEERNARQE